MKKSRLCENYVKVPRRECLRCSGYNDECSDYITSSDLEEDVELVDPKVKTNNKYRNPFKRGGYGRGWGE